MDPPPPSVDVPVYSRPSSVSELDSPSDSDWLDLSSSRESDDNDSVSTDSDRERVDDIPPSRRSSISLGSSREGDIEAWEGFVDDSADEASVVDPVAANNALQIVSSAAHEIITPTAVEEQDDEDKRVKDALDQSMTSTLSASRSAASVRHATPQGSPRDIKLSFPDPLTSSRDELNTSFEEVSQTDSAFSFSEDTKQEVAAQPDEQSAPPTKDPGTLPTPVVLQEGAINHTQLTCYLDIVLFGSSPPFKWSSIDNLVKKLTSASGDRAVILTHKITQITQTYTRTLHVHDKEHAEHVPTFVVSVTDRTESNPRRSHVSTTRPSHRSCLAVVYLPSTSSLPSSTEYDYYLPVLAHTAADVDEAETALEALRIWDELSIPTSKVVQLQESEFGIIDGDYVDQLQPSHVEHVFKRISAPDTKKSIRGFTRLNSVSSVTLFALLSVILGFTVSATYRWSHPPPSKPSPALWTCVSTTINHSTAVPPVSTNSNEPIIVSSMKEFALAVFNPGSTSLSEQRSAMSEQAKTVDGRKAWFEKAKPQPKDPGSASPAKQEDKPSSGSQGQFPDMVTSLSLKIPDSISPFFDFKNVFEAAEIDTAEIMTALDNLAAAISKQTSSIVEKSLDTAQVLRDHLRHRNARAKGKAKELREMGEQLISNAEGRIRERAGKAKVKARALKERYLANAGYSCSTEQGSVKSGRKSGKRRRRRASNLFCGSF